MGLILCPECGTKISDKATKCPHCGFQSADPTRPISEQDKYEVVPVFGYDIEEGNRQGHHIGNEAAALHADRCEHVPEVRVEAQELNERIEELRASLLPQAIRYDKESVQTSPTDLFSDRMSQILDYEQMLCDKLSLLINRREKAQEMIDALPDPRERRILSLYFLSGKRLRMTDVAKSIGYSPQQTYRLYSRAIMRVNESK